MTVETEKNPQQEREALEAEVEQAEQEAIAAENSAEVVEEVAPLSPEQTLEKERDEWKEKAYRLAADMENLKKRSAKDLQDGRKYAVTSFARELLSVQDNMERAIKTVEDTAGSEAEALKPVLEGLQMVSGQLLRAFESAKIAKIEAVGQKLNPELHQAVVEIPTNDAEVGTVVQEIQAGYTIADRLLRPAMVGTAKKLES